MLKLLLYQLLCITLVYFIIIIYFKLFFFKKKYLLFDQVRAASMKLFHSEGSFLYNSIARFLI